MPRPTPLKPQTLLQWAMSTFALKKAPPLQRKEQGWQLNEQPPAGWLNWVFNAHAKWAAWLNDNFNDYGVSNNERVRLFGTGQDGDLTLTTAIALTRDMFYENLTIQSGGRIHTNNYRVFVRNTLTLTGANAAFIAVTTPGEGGGAGVAGSPSGAVTPNTNGAAMPAGTYGASGSGGEGGGGAGTGSGANTSAILNANGVGKGGNGGAGGTGTGGAGRPSGSGGATTLTTRLDKINPSYLNGLLRTQGASGGAGAGGGGVGGGNGGGGGGGGAGAGVIDVRAYKIVRGGTAPLFDARGGAGGAGGNPSNVNRGSGGGGAGGGGGTVFLLFADLDGNAVTDAVDASGGAGGGSIGAANRNGQGGQGGKGGSITIFNLAERTTTTVDGVNGSAGGAANQAGGVATGGAGGAAKATF